MNCNTAEFDSSSRNVVSRAQVTEIVLISARPDTPSSWPSNWQPRKKGQQTALATEELPAFLHALATYKGDVATRLRLLILTLARTEQNKVKGACDRGVPVRVARPRLPQANSFLA
jgi:hypothetical protein